MGKHREHRENMETETNGCVLDIHFGGGTHFDQRSLTVVEKSLTNKCQSKNSTPTTPCLCKHNGEHAFYSNCSSGGHTRARFGHSEVFEKMTDEWSSLLAPGDKIAPIIAFGRRFLVELPPRSPLLSHSV
jgi:hypothetical protein